MNKIFAPFLPPWVETGLQPAFYDMESGTVLQQTARMYAKVQQLTRLFNEFSEDVSNEVNNFEHDTNTEIERFEKATNDEIERFEGVVNNTVAEYIEKFTELKDFVDDYFDNLDVQEEINNKLDAMVEDGTFNKIINHELFDGLQAQVDNKLDKDQPQYGKLPYERYGRFVDPTFSLDATVDGYYGMQGGTAIDDNTYVFLTNHFSGTNTLADEMCKIRKVNLTTGEIITSKTVALGHGNGICYDSTTSKYYVTPAHGNVNDSGYANTIITLDSNFNLVQTDPVSVNFDSISVDKDGSLYGGVSYKPSGVAVYKLNKTDFSILETITLDMPVPDTLGTGANVVVRNGYIYYLQFNPNAVFVFDMEGNNVENYSLKDNEFYPLGELENISVLDDGTFIIGSMYDPVGGLYKFDNIIRVNPIKGICIKESAGLYNALKQPLNSINLYVDPDSTVFAPDGTNSKPFKCLDEAMALKIKNPITIHLTNNKTHYVTRINSFDGVIDGGTGATISLGATETRLMIRNSNIYFNSVSQLPSIFATYSSNLKIYNSNLNHTGTGYLVRAENGATVNLEKITIAPTEDLSNYLFIGNHGTIVYDKDNVGMTTSGLSAITKWFNGDIRFIRPFIVYSGSLSSEDTLTINNGNMAPFKNFVIRYNDHGIANLPAINGIYQNTVINITESGAGTSRIREIQNALSDGVLSTTKIRELVYAPNGTMTVNTTPTVTIQSIYAL